MKSGKDRAFNASRLVLARKRRQFTKKHLAESSGVSTRSLTDYETGKATPGATALSSLAKTLKFPESFFFQKTIPEPSPQTASFRSLKRMSAKQRDAALTAGALAIDFSNWIEERYQIPRFDVPDLSSYSPSEAAVMLRVEWGLGLGKLPNLVHLLESKGVRVFSLAQDCVEIDAFCVWVNAIPYVFLNNQKSAERSRFDAAHELGHLVLHQNQDERGREIEQQANDFAAALLMPRESVEEYDFCPTCLNDFINLKRNWGVSTAALIRRFYSLSLITEWKYRSLCIDLAKAGYRTHEPLEMPREKSRVLDCILSDLRGKGVSLQSVCEDLHIAVDDLTPFLFGLAMFAIEGNGKSRGFLNASNRPKLRLVSS